MRSKDCQDLVQARTKAARNLWNTVSSVRFEKVYEICDLPTQKRIQELVAMIDMAEANRLLESLLKEKAQDEYALMPMRDLRLIGQKLGIAKYNILTKASLLSSIQNRKKNAEQDVSTSISGEDKTQAACRSGESASDDVPRGQRDIQPDVCENMALRIS